MRWYSLDKTCHAKDVTLRSLGKDIESDVIKGLHQGEVDHSGIVDNNIERGAFQSRKHLSNNIRPSVSVKKIATYGNSFLCPKLAVFSQDFVSGFFAVGVCHSHSTYAFLRKLERNAGTYPTTASSD